MAKRRAELKGVLYNKEGQGGTAERRNGAISNTERVVVAVALSIWSSCGCCSLKGGAAGRQNRRGSKQRSRLRRIFVPCALGPQLQSLAIYITNGVRCCPAS